VLFKAILSDVENKQVLEASNGPAWFTSTHVLLDGGLVNFDGVRLAFAKSFPPVGGIPRRRLCGDDPRPNLGRGGHDFPQSR
jgi:hypothetical protein